MTSNSESFASGMFPKSFKMKRVDRAGLIIKLTKNADQDRLLRLKRAESRLHEVQINAVESDPLSRLDSGN